MAAQGSIVVRRQLGRQLRDLREEAGKTIRDVAEARLFSQSKLFRIESGRVPVKMGDVWTLCRFYGADPTLTDALARLSEGSDHDHWWEDHHRVSPNWFHLYRGLESTCGALFTYDPELVHGLLQTEEYTDCVIATDGERDEEVVRRRRDIRLHRKLTFFGRQDVRITMVLGVAALTWGGASPDVLGRQYQHLCDMSAGQRVDVRVLPATVGVRARFHGPFTVLQFDHPEDPTVAYVETHVGAHYFEGAAYVAEYRKAMAILIDQSIPVEDFNYDESLGQVIR